MPGSAGRFARIGFGNERLQSVTGFAHDDEFLQGCINPVSAQTGYIPVLVRMKVPAGNAVIIVEGFRQSPGHKIGIFHGIVVILCSRLHRQEFFAIDEDIFSILHGHMAASVSGHHLGQPVFTLSCFRMVAVAFPLLLFGVRVLIFQKVLRFIGEIIRHTGHSGSPAPGIEARTGHNVEPPLIRFIFRRQGDILGDGITRQPIEFIPVHRAGIHIDHTHAHVLGHRFGIILGAVLFHPMSHFMGKHRRQFIRLQIRAAHQGPVDADIIGWITGGIKILAVIHRPDEGQRIYFQYIMALADQLFHHFIDHLHIMGIRVEAIFFNILCTALHLRTDVVA